MNTESKNILTADPADLWGEPQRIQPLINELAGNLFRASLCDAGFAAINLGRRMESGQFRSLLIGFAAALDAEYQVSHGRRLILRSIGRFDQKVSTEAHLDGAPEESILMLGYEPTEIVSRLFVIDYTRCAAERGFDPAEFLRKFNPTFGDGRLLLADYTTEVTPFDPGDYRVVLINNSSRPLGPRGHGMLGVMHKSTVVDPKPRQTRFINTFLMSPAEPTAEDFISLIDVRAYIDDGRHSSA